jgi:hypothetical protein
MIREVENNRSEWDSKRGDGIESRHDGCKQGKIDSSLLLVKKKDVTMNSF